jgi:hypothetical protein
VPAETRGAGFRPAKDAAEPSSSYENTTPARRNQQLIETVLRRQLGFGLGAGDGRKGSRLTNQAVLGVRFVKLRFTQGFVLYSIRVLSAFISG